MNKYLGIDYGLVHIGLASSEQSLATPLSSLNNTSELVPRLVEIIAREGITHIVCGIPEGKIAEQVKVFARMLETATKLPVILHPETLSTQEAQHKLQQAGAKMSKRRNDHAYAACLILEDYLELQNSVN